MKLTFHGGAGEVAGANYVLESEGVKIMIDCGLNQGTHFAEKQNFEPFKYNPSEISAVLVTHAHIDHTGRLPKLCRDGYRGPIYSTLPTKEFAELLLLDSEHILRKESERVAKPSICDDADVYQAMKLWHGVKYHEPMKIGPFVITFYNAGHILGSAIIKIEAEGETILFSGDLGNYPAPIIQDTEMFKAADYVVLESAYGSRIHENPEKRREALEDVVEDTVRNGGTLMIPAFAMERTQDILFHLNDLSESGRIPRVPIFIDSPLAIKLTYVYEKYQDYFDPEVGERIRSGDDIFNFKGLHFTLTTEQSKEINSVPPPKVIIAGSGMSNGGRILHHEQRYLPDPKSTILFIGYQSVGTLGRQIMEGAKTVKIYDEIVPVRAKIATISGYSAHADQPRLVGWVRPMRHSLKKVFIVQGEQESSEALQNIIQDELAVRAVVPKSHEEFVI
jgi:metallo-beta-lactamase family protein